MILLDTDTLTLYLAGHEGVRRRVEQAEDDLAITIITRIEILQGRFAFLLKAKDGAQLLQAGAAPRPVGNRPHRPGGRSPR